jgi:hypothetical protein
LRVRDGEDGVLALELEALPAAQATIEGAPQPAELAAASSAVPVREPGPLSREATASDRGARARSTFAFVALGVGAAGVVATAVLGGLALERKGAADEHCPDKLCSDEGWRARNQMNGFATAATAASIVAGVGLAVGAVLWFTADSAQREGTRALRIEPRIGLGSAGLAGRF